MIDILQVQNYVQFKSQYDTIVQECVLARNESKLTQKFVAEWIEVDRRRVIEFEKSKTIDVELLCIVCEKFDIDIELILN